MVSIGTILGLPDIRDAVGDRAGAGGRGVADHRRRAGARHGRRLPAGDRRRGVSAEGVGRHYGARKDGGLLDGWLVHDGDAADVPGVEVRAVPLLMTDDEATAAMVRAALELA